MRQWEPPLDGIVDLFPPEQQSLMGKTGQIRNIIQTSGGVGMQTLENSLNALLAAGKITRETALARASNPMEIA